MAKKKSKKNNTKNLLITLGIVLLAVVTVCTIFMPVFTTKSTALGATSTSHIKGWDVIVAAFKGETSTDLSSGANSLILLKGGEDAGVATTIFCWTYFISVIVSLAILVFGILKVLGMRFALVNSILGIALVVLALITFILGFVVASKFASVDLGAWLSGKTHASVACYFMLLAMVCGGANLYFAKK